MGKWDTIVQGKTDVLKWAKTHRDDDGEQICGFTITNQTLIEYKYDIEHIILQINKLVEPDFTIHISPTVLLQCKIVVDLLPQDSGLCQTCCPEIATVDELLELSRYKLLKLANQQYKTMTAPQKGGPTAAQLQDFLNGRLLQGGIKNIEFNVASLSVTL